jgi:lipoprotein signal peptidase
VFFGLVAAIAFLADILSKAWAEIRLTELALSGGSLELIANHLSFRLAYNQGGAWGLFSGSPDYIRRPFFIIVSILAIGFIVSLYGRISARQHALKWGLPLVLGGALGNFADRIARRHVVDFIDFRADWVETMNRVISSVFGSWGVTDHWPTFNVADIAICIGVGLMAIDMFTARREPADHPSEARAGEPHVLRHPVSELLHAPRHRVHPGYRRGRADREAHRPEPRRHRRPRSRHAHRRRGGCAALARAR